MILVIKRSVLPILDLLEVLGQGHLGVEETVFVNVLLVLDFVLVSELGQGGLMLLVELSHSGLVLLLSGDFFIAAAGQQGLVVLCVVMGLQVALRVSDQLGDLGLVLVLYRLGCFQLFLQLSSAGFLLLSGIDAVPLQVIQCALDVNDSVGAVHPQSINFRLDAADVFVDGLAQLQFLLRRKNLVFCCHMQYLPL